MPDNKGASGCGYLSVWNVWLFVSPKPIDVVTDKSISFTRADMFHKDRSLDQRTALSAPGCSVQDKLQVAQLSWPPPHPFWEGKRGGLNKGPLIVSARDIVTRIAFSSPRSKWPSFHTDQRNTVVSDFLRWKPNLIEGELFWKLISEPAWSLWHLGLVFWFHEWSVHVRMSEWDPNESSIKNHIAMIFPTGCALMEHTCHKKGTIAS